LLLRIYFYPLRLSLKVKFALLAGRITSPCRCSEPLGQQISVNLAGLYLSN
jgi:hypothetical protein